LVTLALDAVYFSIEKEDQIRTRSET
jgi:hypothetical protein